MILSMTGYGRGQQVLHGRDITVEIRSVNARYFEYSSRIPRGFQFLDDKLKKLLSAQISRGKTELNLTIQAVGVADTHIQVNMELAKGYYAAVQSLAETFSIDGTMSAASLARFPDLFIAQKSEQDEEQLWQDVAEVAQEALSHFVSMRTAEGEKLQEDILMRLAFLENAVQQVEATSAERVQKYTEKLFARLQELLQSTNIDESRILTEAAIFADKTAVDEETVRLRSHIDQYRSILKDGGAVGRKLDFLTQELNRETNTIGSKCNEVSMTRVVVDMKSEIEKIREQIQNIE